MTIIKTIASALPNKVPLRLILAVEGISSLVNQIFQVLLPWYILSSTGSMAWMGITAFASLAPGIFASLAGGWIIDKFGRSKTMFACELAQFVLIALIPLLIISGKATPFLIALIILISGFFDIPAQIARQALLPSYSRYAAIPLHKSEGYKEAIDGFMAVAGPVCAGLFIAIYGLPASWILAASLCLLTTFLAAIMLTGRKTVKLNNGGTYLQAWHYLKTEKFLLMVIIFTLPLFILGESWELLILPTYVHTFRHNAMFLGFLEAAFGLGAFAGALSFAKMGKRFKFFTLLTLDYAAYALAAVALMINLPNYIVILVSFLSGVPFGAFTAMVTTILLTAVPPHLRAKTLGLFAASAALVESICVLIIGFLLQAKGLYFTLSSAVIIFFILMAAGLFYRSKETSPALLKYDDKNIF